MLNSPSVDHRRLVQAIMGEERVEEDMITLYRSLIDDGALSCIKPGKQGVFTKIVNILHDDSLAHQRAMFALLEKVRAEAQ